MGERGRRERTTTQPAEGTAAPQAASPATTSATAAGLLALQRSAGNSATLAHLQRKETGAKATGLPDQLKSSIESLSGVSMDDVRVHYNSSEPAALSAGAYAQGTDIHVAPGQEKHLPHEAWHIVQQKGGVVPKGAVQA